MAILFTIDGLLVALFVADNLAGHPLGDIWVRQFFDLEYEQNLPTWFASVQLALAAFLLAIFVVNRSARERGRTWFLAVVPLVALFMSLDEIAEIHEKIGYKSDMLLPEGTRAGTTFHYTGIWMFLVGVPFVLVTLFVFRHLIRNSTIRASSFRRMLLGFLLLVAGAAGVEVWSNFTFSSPRLHLVQVSLEEGCELLGGTLIVWGAIELLRASGFRLVREHAGHGSGSRDPDPVV